MVGAYHEKRALSGGEVAAMPELMWATAVACAYYRFCEFRVKRRDDEGVDEEQLCDHEAGSIGTGI